MLSYIKNLSVREERYAISVVIVFWLFVAGWHPFYLGFFSDDWSLFILKSREGFLLDLMRLYPNYPAVLVRAEIYPNLMANRPGYAVLLYLFKKMEK